MLLVCIEGGIGVGKSTAMKALRDAFSDNRAVAFVDEPVDKWVSAGILGDVYSGTLPSGTFQHCALMTRVAGIVRATSGEENAAVRVVVTERSPYSDSEVFATVNLSDAELRAYALTWAELMPLLPAHRTHFVMMEAPISTLQTRMGARQRKSEANVSASYLVRLMKAHDQFAETHKADLTRVDASQAPEAVARAVVGVVQNVVAASNCKAASVHQPDAPCSS